MNQSQKITDIREYRLKRKRAGSAKWILVLVFLVACLFAGYFFARSDFFNISRIEVTGNSSVAAQRIIQLSGYTTGVNIFSITASDAEQWILIEPGVLSAQVKRRLPGLVEISVRERTPAALLNTGQAIIEIDLTGRVLNRYTVFAGADLPLISGVDLSGCGTVPGSIVDADGMGEALAILSEIGEDKSIGEINVSNTQNIKLYSQHGVEVRIGDTSDFAEKYLLFSVILDNLMEKNDQIVKYIDVSVISDPVIR